MRITICGGGNLAHALAATLGSDSANEVRILTRRPAEWSSSIQGLREDGSWITGCVSRISDDPFDVIPGSEIVLFALPSNARESVLRSIAPHLAHGAAVGFFPGMGGFDWIWRKVFGTSRPDLAVFASQRVPFICRTIQYGRKINISSRKPSIRVVSIPSARHDEIASALESVLGMKIEPLSSPLEVTLSTSNPILHPARMYGLFRDYQPGSTWDSNPPFYESWDDFSSKILVDMDTEVHEVIKRIPADLSGIKPLLEHYGVGTPEELTRKISSIPAFRGISSPMVHTSRGWILNIESRYFSEDIAEGLVIIKAIAELADCYTSTIDEVLSWAQRMMRKEYLVNGRLCGADLANAPIPGNFGIHTLQGLVSQQMPSTFTGA